MKSRLSQRKYLEAKPDVISIDFTTHYHQKATGLRRNQITLLVL